MPFTVLCVNWDIIMSPCICLYDRYINESQKRITNWSEIERILDLNRHLIYDVDTYHKIGKIISYICDRVPRVYVGNFSDSVLCSIEDEMKLQSVPDNKLNIINIGHYHSIYEPNGPHSLRALVDEKVTSRNWVGYLEMCKCLNEYVWIHDRNSSQFIPSTSNEPILQKSSQVCIEDISLDYGFFDNVDVLYICTNFSRIPPKFDDLVINTLRIPCIKNFDHTIFYDSDYCTYLSGKIYSFFSNRFRRYLKSV